MQNDNRTNVLRIGIIALGVMLVIVGTAVTIAIWSNAEATTPTSSEDDTSNLENIVLTNRYSDVLKVYYELDDEAIAVDDLQEQVEKMKLNVNFAAGSEKGIISDKDNEKEYITFEVTREEEDAPDTAYNFVYHETIDDREYMIKKSGENTYQHFNSIITNEFEKKSDAIEDHLIYKN